MSTPNHLLEPDRSTERIARYQLQTCQACSARAGDVNSTRTCSLQSSQVIVHAASPASGKGGASPHDTAMSVSPPPISRPTPHPVSPARSASVLFPRSHARPPAPLSAAIAVPSPRSRAARADASGAQFAGRNSVANMERRRSAGRRMDGTDGELGCATGSGDHSSCVKRSDIRCASSGAVCVLFVRSAQCAGPAVMQPETNPSNTCKC